MPANLPQTLYLRCPAKRFSSYLGPRLRMSATSVQSRLASLSISDKQPLSPLKPPTPTLLVTELLEKNDGEHHIYFGPNDFHNHFPHTLLSQFALGAPDSRLKKEWDIEDYLEPLGEKQPTEITDENWKKHIGDGKFYHNYLDYFKSKIAKNGVQRTVLDYALDETLLPSFVSGAVHPLIHVGYGLEFGSEMVVAEGLAEACVHNPTLAPVVDPKLYSQPATDKKSLLAIVNEICHDKIFDDVVKYADFPKYRPVLQSKKACDAIKQYVMKWSFDDTPEGLAKAFTELFELVTYFTVTSAFPPPHVVDNPKYKDVKFRPLLDFFLMHTLTGTFGLRALLPYVPMEKRPLVLRVDLAVGLMYYISRGRPLIQPSELPKTPWSWDTIIEKTWADEDLHVPKVIRALKVIAVECGEMDEELARNAAGLIVQEKVVNRRRWSMLGHGFDEAWEEVSKEN